MNKAQKNAIKTAIAKLKFGRASFRNDETVKMQDLRLYLDTWVIPALSAALENAEGKMDARDLMRYVDFDAIHFETIRENIGGQK